MRSTNFSIYFLFQFISKRWRQKFSIKNSTISPVNQKQKSNHHPLHFPRSYLHTKKNRQHSNLQFLINPKNSRTFSLLFQFLSAFPMFCGDILREIFRWWFKKNCVYSGAIFSFNWCKNKLEKLFVLILILILMEVCRYFSFFFWMDFWGSFL
jgi:hypothetical protein